MFTVPRTVTKIWKKVQQKLLHFFVRYAIMYHSDEQMSLIQKQISKVFLWEE